MIGVGLLRGVFLGGIMLWYTMGVWKTVDQYFRDQFQEYLSKEYEENAAMKRDVLLEKERIAAKKVLLEKISELESNVMLEDGAEWGVGEEEPGAEVDGECPADGECEGALPTWRRGAFGGGDDDVCPLEGGGGHGGPCSQSAEEEEGPPGEL